MISDLTKKNEIQKAMQLHVEKIAQNRGLQGLISLVEVFSEIIKERVSAEMDSFP